MYYYWLQFDTINWILNKLTHACILRCNVSPSNALHDDVAYCKRWSSHSTPSHLLSFIAPRFLRIQQSQILNSVWTTTSLWSDVIWECVTIVFFEPPSMARVLFNSLLICSENHKWYFYDLLIIVNARVK